MTDLKKFRRMIKDIDELKKLEWRNPRSSVWINKVLRFLKQEFGEDSDYYKQFHRTTYGQTVLVTSGMTEEYFQRQHVNRLNEYKEYLEAYIDEWKEGEISEVKTNFPNELKLHPKIINASEKLFEDGHFSQAIFEASKVLEKEIKSKSGIRGKTGVDLVNHAFRKENPKIILVKGQEQEQVDEREGFRFLFMGTFLGIKNPKSHSIQYLKDSDKTLEYLAFISLLMKRLDESDSRTHA